MGQQETSHHKNFKGKVSWDDFESCAENFNQD